MEEVAAVGVNAKAGRVDDLSGAGLSVGGVNTKVYAFRDIKDGDARKVVESGGYFKTWVGVALAFAGMTALGSLVRSAMPLLGTLRDVILREPLKRLPEALGLGGAAGALPMSSKCDVR